MRAAGNNGTRNEGGVQVKLVRRNLSGVAAVVAIFGSGLTAYGAEDYTQWTHACNITLNTSGTGANVATQQLGFPVLVRLTSTTPAFSFGQTMAAGQDIRFSKADGTHIPYQIERFDQTNQLAEIWVKVDVNGNDLHNSSPCTGARLVLRTVRTALPCSTTDSPGYGTWVRPEQGPELTQRETGLMRFPLITPA